MNTRFLPPILRRGLALSTLPWFRLELPGWFRIAGPLGLCIGEEALWSGLPVAVIKGKHHGYRMPLHLEDWCERLTYFLGRYYELELQKLMEAALRPGDVFVDVGANIGMITLSAARLVGARGRIWAVEPCPSNVERLREMVDLNQLTNVTVLPMGAGDQEATLPFQIVKETKGWSTFAFRAPVPGLAYETTLIPVRPLDLSLPGDLGPNTFVKIDVEGYELHALRGMASLLQKHPAVVTEVEPSLLQNAGSKAGDLERLLREQGYDGFYFEWVRSGLRHALTLRSVTGGIDPEVARNVLWVHPQSLFRTRLEAFIQ